MRILYLSQYFPPEVGAPAARVSELSKRWAGRGHQVCVLTAFPNHPTGVVPPEYRGKISLADVRTWAIESCGDDAGGYREQFIQLVDKAAELAAMGS